jgi:hypothetical protein
MTGEQTKLCIKINFQLTMLLVIQFVSKKKYVIFIFSSYLIIPVGQYKIRKESLKLRIHFYFIFL